MPTLTFDPFNPSDVEAALKLLRSLHPEIEQEEASPVPTPPVPTPPVPTPPVPTPPVPTPPEPTPPVLPAADLDVDGVAWDAEIHASSKAKTKDGRWRRKRKTKKAPPRAASASAAPNPPGPPTDEVTWGYVVEAVVACKNAGIDAQKVSAEMQLRGIDMATLYGQPAQWGAALAVLNQLAGRE